MNLNQYASYRAHGGKKTLRHFVRKGPFRYVFSKQAVLNDCKTLGLTDVIFSTVCTLDFLQILAPRKVLWGIKTSIEQYASSRFEYLKMRGRLLTDPMDYLLRSIVWEQAFELAESYLDRRQRRNLRRFQRRLIRHYRKVIEVAKELTESGTEPSDGKN